MGRKNLLKSTKKGSPNPKKIDSQLNADRKKAILDGVQRYPASVRATLEKVGLAQSTYYKWLQRYKAEGLDGLKRGGPVPDKVWKRFSELKGKQGEQIQAESKSKVEEKRTMKDEKDSKKIRELLFKKFDEEPSRPAREEVESGKEPGEPAGPREEKEAPSPPSYTPPPEEPMSKAVKYAIGAFALVVAILLIASVSNSNRFYFKHNKQMVELWQGRFAPMGKTRVASFSDSGILEGLPERESYTKEEAYGVLYDYLIEQADTILNTGRTPDLKAVKSYLTHASKYAVSDSQRQAILTRSNSINFLVSCGKADVALSKETIPDFKVAKRHLTEAMRFASTEVQKDVITKRLAAIDYAVEAGKSVEGKKQLMGLYREALERKEESEQKVAEVKK